MACLPSPQRWARTICGPSQLRHETAPAELVALVRCGGRQAQSGAWAGCALPRYGLGWLAVAAGPDERDWFSAEVYDHRHRREPSVTCRTGTREATSSGSGGRRWRIGWLSRQHAATVAKRGVGVALATSIEEFQGRQGHRPGLLGPKPERRSPGARRRGPTGGIA